MTRVYHFAAPAIHSMADFCHIRDSVHILTSPLRANLAYMRSQRDLMTKTKHFHT